MSVVISLCYVCSVSLTETADGAGWGPGTDLPSVLWCFQEKSIDEGDGIGLDLLVGPEGISGNGTTS